MGIGVNKAKEGKYGEFDVRKEPITVLGLEFEPDLKRMRAANMGGQNCENEKGSTNVAGKKPHSHR